jgi:hypothetical protein
MSISLDPQVLDEQVDHLVAVRDVQVGIGRDELFAFATPKSVIVHCDVCVPVRNQGCR